MPVSKTNIKICGNCIHFDGEEGKDLCNIKNERVDCTNNACQKYQEYMKGWEEIYFLGYDY